MTVILNIKSVSVFWGVCVCVCTDSLENLVKWLVFSSRTGRWGGTAYTIYRPKFAYNFKGFSDPFEAHAGEEKQTKNKKQDT